jgi:dephospho-CoA kinase
MARDQAEKRIASQMPLEEKRKTAAGMIAEIDCSGSLEYTGRQVQTLVENLKQMAGASAS